MRFGGIDWLAFTKFAIIITISVVNFDDFSTLTSTRGEIKNLSSADYSTAVTKDSD